MRIFDRLVGLETEYAIRAAERSTGRPTDRAFYFDLIERLRSRLPIARAEFSESGKMGVFLANGGAVWFERCLLAGGVGLIEGATAECRTPRDLLCWQRAQDKLLSDAVAQSEYDFSLVKNCRDSEGNSYGAQENYDVPFASGWRLRLWRVGIRILAPIMLVWLILTCLPLMLLGLPRLWRRAQRHEQGARDGEPDYHPFWQWHESHMFWDPALDWILTPMMRILPAPAIVAINSLYLFTEHRVIQKKLTPFLITRTIFAGAGSLDKRGRFCLAEKALDRDREWFGITADSGTPIYNVGHHMKGFMSFLTSREDPLGVLQSRQRLQVTLGDSNMCEYAEYLRIATTTLVLDAIEAGFIKRGPRLWSPIRALRTICRDESLTARLGMRWRSRMTALEIQREYLTACRKFVASREDAPQEAHDVLREWADTLDTLATNPDELIGKIDWVTKRHMLRSAGAGLSAAARQTIALRYHELSDVGYFNRFATTGAVTQLVEEQALDFAVRMPPPNTRAALRGRYIREFSDPDTVLTVGWNRISIAGEAGGKPQTVLKLPAEARAPDGAPDS